MSRPTKASLGEEARDAYIKVMLTPSEKEEFKRFAEAQGTPPAVLTRQLMLKAARSDD